MVTGQIVTPGKIQSTLDDLWNAKDNKNKVRASLFNLIFCVKKSPREEYVRKIALKLVEKFPARVFFLLLDPASTDPLQTSVSILSTKQGAFDITCDFIEILASPAEEHKIPFLLLPNIIPDLPTFLLWSEDPSQSSSLCDSLQQLANRVIFDSESAENLELFAQTVLHKRQQLSGHTDLADLNWARLETWRSLLCATFADADSVKKFQQATTLQITYNGQETPSFCHTKIQALYLQSWIASCLGWKKINTTTYASKEGQVSITLKEVKNAKLPPGMVVSLEVESACGDHFYFFRKDQAPEEISFEHSTLTECSIPIRLQVSKGESGQSLVKEICQKGTSVHYIKTLELITQEPK